MAKIKMDKSITLRSALMKDADILLDWRNDPETRTHSYNMSLVSKEEHTAWLAKTLNDDNRQLFIAQEGAVPVGTVRADLSENAWILSWTVAPNARGRCVGKQMVALAAGQIAEPIRAEVKADNDASARIAEFAGMSLVREEKCIHYYYRKALRELEA